MTNPFKAYQSAESTLIRKLMSVEKLGVTNPRRLRRLWLAGGARFIIGFGSLVAFAIWPNTIFGLITSAILGMIIGTSCFGWLRRARAYQSGWLNGRHAMILALQEAARRGISVEDWVHGEIDRDLALMAADMGVDQQE